jgi:hypothetical protein
LAKLLFFVGEADKYSASPNPAFFVGEADKDSASK